MQPMPHLLLKASLTLAEQLERLVRDRLLDFDAADILEPLYEHRDDLLANDERG